jgi:hypothetical protein
MRQSFIKRKLGSSEYLGCAIAGCILFMHVLFFLHLYAPRELSSFLGVSASGWVQAIGSIFAIFASFKLGERSFQRQMVKEEIAELNKKLHAYEVIYEIFSSANAVDVLCAHTASQPDMAKMNLAAAQDTLVLLRSLPVMDAPKGDHIRQLNLCSQAMRSYIGWAEEFVLNLDTTHLPFWQEFAKDSCKQSQEFIKDCEIAILGLKREISKASLRLA